MGEMVKWAVIENIVTLLMTAAIVLGAYAMGAGGWSFWGLLLLANLNTVKTTAGKSDA